MKKTITKLIFTGAFLLLAFINSKAQQAIINDTLSVKTYIKVGDTAFRASAQGINIMPMTTLQRVNLVTPRENTMVYDTNQKCLYYYFNRNWYAL